MFVHFLLKLGLRFIRFTFFPNSDSELKGSSRGQKIGPRIRPGGVRASLYRGPGGNGFWPPLSHFRALSPESNPELATPITLSSPEPRNWPPLSHFRALS